MVLGRPRCILETNRVDRRPGNAVASSDFGDWRGQRDEKAGFLEREEEAEPVLEAFRGGGEGKGLVRETF